MSRYGDAGLAGSKPRSRNEDRRQKDQNSQTGLTARDTRGQVFTTEAEKTADNGLQTLMRVQVAS